uniref:Centaurin-gamma-1A n=1 Tax=Rhabditophanes sp. KR3021 TaxID=114890 RepID=A0AC35UCV7_9BILA
MNMTIGAGCEEFFMSSDEEEEEIPFKRSKPLHSVSFFEQKAIPKLLSFKTKLNIQRKSSFAVLKDFFNKPKSNKLLKMEEIPSIKNQILKPCVGDALLSNKNRIKAYSKYIPERAKLHKRISTNPNCYYIKDSFVNSQEWTVSRNVPELRLGIVGSLSSGKASLTHRFLTGAFTRDEPVEGGRFKKEVVLEGQSYLLLLRDDGSVLFDGNDKETVKNDRQFSQWFDAIIFVFNIYSRESFEDIYKYYQHISKHRSLADTPIILVGTQDSLSESSQRLVTEAEARAMATKLKKCGYIETCATYGLNVETVFKNGNSSIAVASRNITPTNNPSPPADYIFNNGGHYVTSRASNLPNYSRSISSVGHSEKDPRRGSHYLNNQQHFNLGPPTFNTYKEAQMGRLDPKQTSRPPSIAPDYGTVKSLHQPPPDDFHHGLGSSATVSRLPTPSSTPTAQRKNRRISNLWKSGKDHHEDKPSHAPILNLGAGRVIPIKQGLLYKKSSKSLNKEWKKKFVCLHSDGRLCYHQNLKDYMDKNSNGKEVFLGLATVRLSGRARPRVTQRASVAVASSSGKENLGPMLKTGRYSLAPNDELLASLSNPCLDIGPSGAISPTNDGTSGNSDNGEGVPCGSGSMSKATAAAMINAPNSISHSALKKKRGHRRLGSSSKNDEEDDCEFEIVSYDQKRWEFSAASPEERDEWVSIIQEQIEKSLQQQMSQKTKTSSRVHGLKEQIQSLRDIPGNNYCADCNALKPDWASLNLGTLICIECSGVHRNLGTHISKVRSLELDEWPIEYLSVMKAIGNDVSNRLWEHHALKEKKPSFDASHEAKEAWIRAKYEQKRFLPPIPVDKTLSRQLVDAIVTKDLFQILLVLSRCTDKEVNSRVSTRDKRTPAHLACSLGNVEILQLLIWYNADLKLLDDTNHSSLWHAKNTGNKECVDVIINNGISPNYGCDDFTPEHQQNNYNFNEVDETSQEVQFRKKYECN